MKNIFILYHLQLPTLKFMYDNSYDFESTNLIDNIKQIADAVQNDL